MEVAQTNQYGRRNNIEFSGISNDVEDSELEDKVVELCDNIDIKIKRRDIEACHRLPVSRKNPQKKVIVRFVNRKNVEKTLKAKKKLPTGVYANENLNQYYQKIAWRCRLLKKSLLIESYKYQNESFRILIPEDGYKKVTCERQLFKLFPGFFADDMIENDTVVLEVAEETNYIFIRHGKSNVFF